jgi:hypothetical protein
MEPEGSSPHTQEPATCPYPEPDQPSLRPHTQPLEELYINTCLNLWCLAKFLSKWEMFWQKL